MWVAWTIAILVAATPRPYTVPGYCLENTASCACYIPATAEHQMVWSNTVVTLVRQAHGKKKLALLGTTAMLESVGADVQGAVIWPRTEREEHIDG